MKFKIYPIGFDKEIKKKLTKVGEITSEETLADLDFKIRKSYQEDESYMNGELFGKIDDTEAMDIFDFGDDTHQSFFFIGTNPWKKGQSFEPEKNLSTTIATVIEASQKNLSYIYDIGENHIFKVRFK